MGIQQMWKIKLFLKRIMLQQDLIYQMHWMRIKVSVDKMNEMKCIEWKVRKEERKEWFLLKILVACHCQRFCLKSDAQST